MIPAKKRGYICPQCGNGSGKDGTGIEPVPMSPRHYHCFKCGFHGDEYDIEDAEKSQPAGTAWRERNGKSESMIKYLNECHQRLPDSKGETYLLSRGLTADTLTRFSLGYDPEHNSITIPYSKDMSYYASRTIGGKQFFKPKAEEAGAEPIFNASTLWAEPVVFVVESQLCAISIMQAGGAAIALGGTGIRKLVDTLNERTSFSRLILCFDNDEAGRRATEQASYYSPIKNVAKWSE